MLLQLFEEVSKVFRGFIIDLIGLKIILLHAWDLECGSVREKAVNSPLRSRESGRYSIHSINFLYWFSIRLRCRQYRQVISVIRPWIPLIKARKGYTLLAGGPNNRYTVISSRHFLGIIKRECLYFRRKYWMRNAFVLFISKPGVTYPPKLASFTFLKSHIKFKIKTIK